MEKEITKKCTDCKRVLPATKENFGYNKYGKFGLHARCRPCHKRNSHRYRSENPFQIALSKVKRRSLDRGYPFDLDVEHLRELWTGFCPIFGFEIKIGQTGTGHALYDSAALDRKIPSLGYVKGNVIWLSTKANLIKQNATAEEVMAVAIWMKENI